MPRFHRVFPAALLALSACGNPAGAAVAFHQALAQRDGDEALRLLSASTRAELERVAQEAATASEGMVSGDPAKMIVEGDLSIYPPQRGPGERAASATILSQDAHSARIQVKIGTQVSEAELIRESGGWRLVLPISLRAADR